MPPNKIYFVLKTFVPIFFIFATVSAFTQDISAQVQTSTSNQPLLKLWFKNADLNLVLQDYSQKTGRTILPSPQLPQIRISVEGRGGLTLEEYLMAIESILSMHGISLIPVGEKFLKVIPSKNARQEALEIREQLPADSLAETDQLVSQIVTLKHLDIVEAQKAIDPLKHSAFATIIPIERINALLITDTSANINRMLQVIKVLDQPIIPQEEPHVVPIRYARASDIKQKLMEIISQLQEEKQQKSTIPRLQMSGPPGVIRPSVESPPGVIRPPIGVPSTQPSTVMEEIIEQAAKGFIRGKVHIIADDRTNVLIIITRPENMSFFEKIIKVLDVETQPEIIVQILQLEYAEAETVSSTLNSLIGAAEKVKRGEGSELPAGTGSTPSPLSEYVKRIESQPRTAEEKAKIGELSSKNIKILADKRTNSLIIMAPPSDMEIIEKLIKELDIMLPQVLIESVIIQVDLDDQVSSGIQWIQRALILSTKNNSNPDAAVAGIAGGGAGDFVPTPRAATELSSLGSWTTLGGLTAYLTAFSLNLDAVVRFVSTDTRSHILSAPVIVTTDNTKAKITSSEQKYFLKGSTVDQFGNVRPETEIRDIGLEMEITPHINKSGMVMLEISQQLSDPGADQLIEGQGSWPTTKKRSFTASIAVNDRQTLILGGLVRNFNKKQRTKVPLLGDIPLLGRLFNYTSENDVNAEIVVFITPYILDTEEKINSESKRRAEALNIGNVWKKRWSISNLAEENNKN